MLKLDELIMLTRIWGSKVDILYTYLARLGRRLLLAGDDEKAGIAIKNSLRAKNGIQYWAVSCDVCQPETSEDMLTPNTGRFICKQCDDIDLCHVCYETHQEGTKVLESCRSHKFFEVSLESLTHPNDNTAAMTQYG